MEVRSVRLMYFDEVVARQVENDGKMFMKKVDNIADYKVPFGLFEEDLIDFDSFAKWAMARCFPEERVDCKQLLSELGLDRYDRWAIIKKTNAVMTGRDDFLIDFQNE